MRTLALLYQICVTLIILIETSNGRLHYTYHKDHTHVAQNYKKTQDQKDNITLRKHNPAVYSQYGNTHKYSKQLADEALRAGSKIPRKIPTTVIPKTARPKTTKKISYYTYENERQKERSRIIREAYRMASEITPNTFALTEQEARNFTSRIGGEELVALPFQCKRRPVPKYTDCKIAELSEIFLNTTCRPKLSNHDKDPREDLSEDETLPENNQKSLEDFNAQDDGDSTTIQNRQRRSAGAVINNADGSVTTIRFCFERGSLTENNNLRLCRTCSALTVLPENRFPRFINEILCDDLDDRGCLTGEGYCYQNYAFVEFLIDSNKVGTNRLGEWTKYQQKINNFCACQVLSSSLFIAPFVK